MKKVAPLRDKSDAELHSREKDLTEQLFKLRFQRATGALDSPTKMREVRREMARIKTILRERELAQERKRAAGE